MLRGDALNLRGAIVRGSDSPSPRPGAFQVCTNSPEVFDTTPLVSDTNPCKDEAATHLGEPTA